MSENSKRRFHMGCGEPLQIRWRVSHVLAARGATRRGSGQRGGGRSLHGGVKSKS